MLKGKCGHPKVVWSRSSKLRWSVKHNFRLAPVHRPSPCVNPLALFEVASLGTPHVVVLKAGTITALGVLLLGPHPTLQLLTATKCSCRTQCSCLLPKHIRTYFQLCFGSSCIFVVA